MGAVALMGSLRAFVRRRRVRIALFVLAGLASGFLAFALGFHLVCQGPGEPDAPYESAEVARFAAEIPEYKRTEESTYLTLLEWYQVFSYQEYAAHIASSPPSDFRYFAAIGQSWSMYCHAYGYTEGAYPFNAGNHLMLFVIGTSFTVEYALKGFYENTAGRLYELDATDTEEDRYAAEIARDYGEFIERDPWYAYPFGKRAVGVWTETSFFGPDFLRKIERKSFLTLENGAKAGYAALIRLATGAIYGAPPATDYLWIANASPEALAVDGVEVVEDLGNASYVISLPHYQGFTEAVPQLAARGVTFVDISGNDEIVLTAIAPRDWLYELPAGEVLFSKEIVMEPSLARFVILAPVADLHPILIGLPAEGARVEHLFDY